MPLDVVLVAAQAVAHLAAFAHVRSVVHLSVSKHKTHSNTRNRQTLYNINTHSTFRKTLLH